MEINSLMNSSDYLKNVNDISKNALDNTVNKDYENSSDKELMDACKEFEAYFLEQMFKEMQKTIPKSEEENSYSSQIKEYFEGNMLQEITKESTETNSLGLAQMLFEQMKRNNQV